MTWIRDGRSQIPVQCIQAFFLWGFGGLKRSGRDVHTLPSSAEVKNEWSYTSASPVCFRGVDRGFTFFRFVPCNAISTSDYSKRQLIGI